MAEKSDNLSFIFSGYGKREGEDGMDDDGDGGFGSLGSICNFLSFPKKKIRSCYLCHD